jgi:hypothetical protein
MEQNHQQLFDTVQQQLEELQKEITLEEQKLSSLKERFVRLLGSRDVLSMLVQDTSGSGDAKEATNTQENSKK